MCGGYQAKKFYGRDSSGLRVRSEPSLLVSQPHPHHCCYIKSLFVTVQYGWSAQARRPSSLRGRGDDDMLLVHWWSIGNVDRSLMMLVVGLS